MASVAPVLTLYTTPFCPGCFRAKVMLQRFSVPYIERDVTADLDAYDDLLRLTRGQPHVPAIHFPSGELLIDPPPLTLLSRVVELAEVPGSTS